jgi:hypothetical protein
MTPEYAAYMTMLQQRDVIVMALFGLGLASIAGYIVVGQTFPRLRPAFLAGGLALFTLTMLVLARMDIKL